MDGDFRQACDRSGTPYAQDNGRHSCCRRSIADGASGSRMQSSPLSRMSTFSSDTLGPLVLWVDYTTWRFTLLYAQQGLVLVEVLCYIEVMNNCEHYGVPIAFDEASCWCGATFIRGEGWKYSDYELSDDESPYAEDIGVKGYKPWIK